MISDTREVTVSRSNIEDQIAALLYATGVVTDTEEVTQIQFSDLFGKPHTELTTLKITIRKEVLN